MATDLVSTISRYLTPDVVGRLSSAVGIDGSMGQHAVSAAVPAILSGLAGVAGTPGGAQKIAEVVSQQPSNILSSVAEGLSGTGRMADQGAGMLSSLLGPGALAATVTALSKFLGTEGGATRSLLGALAPLVMGVLGREQRNSGLDAAGLGRMLTEQKDSIQSALPAGLSRLLAAPSVSAPQQPRAAYDAPPRQPGAPRAAAQAAPSASWAYWALPLIALGALLWYMMAEDRGPAETVTGADTTTPAVTPGTGTATGPSTKAPGSTAGTEAARTTFLAAAPAEWTSIGNQPNEYVRLDAYDINGQKIGVVSDVLVTADGSMAACLVEVERALGIGEKTVGVPMTAARLERRDNDRRVVISAPKEALQNAPSIDRKPSAPKQQ